MGNKESTNWLRNTNTTLSTTKPSSLSNSLNSIGSLSYKGMPQQQQSKDDDIMIVLVPIINKDLKAIALPPRGTVQRKLDHIDSVSRFGSLTLSFFSCRALNEGDTVYAAPPIPIGTSTHITGQWMKAKVKKVNDPSCIYQIYQIEYDDLNGTVRLIPSKRLAYSTPSPVQLSVGERVIGKWEFSADVA